MYTRDNCGPCRATKAYLLKYGIDFSEINISRNPMIADALIEQGRKSAPVIEWTVDGKSGSWEGHRSEDLEALWYLIRG